MKINSMGTFTTATNFVPLFPPKPVEFKPLVIKQVYYEDQETKAQEPTSGPGASAQSGIAPQDQQTTTRSSE